MEWAKKRIVYDESVYYGSAGDGLAVEDLMAIEGLTEAQVRERYGDSEIFEHAMQLLEQDLSHEYSSLVQFFDGRTSDDMERNPNWGNHVIVSAIVGRWDGERSGVVVYDDLEAALDCSPSWAAAGNVFADCEIQRIWEENGELLVEGAHHDGGVSVIVRQLTDEGERVLGQLDYEGDIPEEGISAMGETYRFGDEAKLLRDMFDSERLSSRPRYLEREYGCPALEYETTLAGVTHSFEADLLEDGGVGVIHKVDGMPIGGGFRAESLSEAERRCEEFAERYLNDQPAPVAEQETREPSWDVAR